MRSIRCLAGLVVFGALMTAASAQVTFSAPRHSPTTFSPINFSRPTSNSPIFSRSQSAVTPFSTVQFTRSQPTPVQGVIPQFQRTNFVAPNFNGSGGLSGSAPLPHPAVSSGQSTRAARTSLDRFSQKLSELK